MLSLRLKTLAGYYHQSLHVYDIGCDHGLLGLSFLHQAAIKKIHLVDPSLEVIKVLQDKIKDSYITKKHIIEIEFKKGQDLILKSESKTVFIAGMGGKEVNEIIQALAPQLSKDDRLVISPHRNILELREYLHHSSLGLIDEISLKDEDQFYQILCLGTSLGIPKTPLFGAQIWKGQIGEEYRKSQLKHFSRHQDPRSRAYTDFLRHLIS